MPSLDDLQLPRKTIGEIMKKYCNDETIAMQKDAKLAISRSTVVFISYIAATAADLSTRKDHRFTGAEVVQALRMLDFDDIADELEVPLSKFNKTLKEKRAKHALVVRQHKNNMKLKNLQNEKSLVGESSESK